MKGRKEESSAYEETNHDNVTVAVKDDVLIDACLSKSRYAEDGLALLPVLRQKVVGFGLQGYRQKKEEELAQTETLGV